MASGNQLRRKEPIWMPAFLHSPLALQVIGLNMGPPWMVLYMCWLTVGADATDASHQPDVSPLARTFWVDSEWLEGVHRGTGMKSAQIEAALNTLHAMRFLRRRKTRIRVELKGVDGWTRTLGAYDKEPAA
jgi:hypothetical protein